MEIKRKKIKKIMKIKRNNSLNKRVEKEAILK